tara:strand:- start:519 stop:701 length:183 start_codon:yes stop_codon:yes gene_type:complete
VRRDTREKKDAEKERRGGSGGGGVFELGGVFFWYHRVARSDVMTFYEMRAQRSEDTKQNF